MRRAARQIVRTVGLAGVTAGLLPGYLGHRRIAPGDATRDRWTRAWARALLRLFAIELEVDGAVPPPSPGRGMLIVANHRSAIDIGVLLACFGGRLVSRADLAGWPLLGRAAAEVGTLFVDRASAQSGASTLRAIERALAAGARVGVFAEGTTFDGDEVRPFHAGAFVAAVRARAEILPVGLAYPRGSGAAYVEESFGAHLGRIAASPGTRVAVAIGAARTVGPGLRAGPLAESTRAEVAALVARARSRLGERP